MAPKPFREIKRPFDQQQRLGDLADLIIEVGIQKFTDNRVSEVCEDLIRNEKNHAKAKELYLAVLERAPTTGNSMYSMSNIMGSAREQYDEGKELLEPLLSKDTKPEPTHDTLWLVGSLIDAHTPMHDLAERIYEHALKNTTDRSNRDFKYSLKGRVCNFMADIGNNKRAREMALGAIEFEKTQPSRNSTSHCLSKRGDTKEDAK